MGGTLRNPSPVLQASSALKAIGSQALSLSTTASGLTVPAGAVAALVQLGNAGGSVTHQWRADGGTASATEGFRESAGAKLWVFGPAMALLSIRSTGSTTGWAEYYSGV